MEIRKSILPQFPFGIQVDYAYTTPDDQHIVVGFTREVVFHGYWDGASEGFSVVKTYPKFQFMLE